jgi:hypothetical protein
MSVPKTSNVLVRFHNSLPCYCNGVLAPCSKPQSAHLLSVIRDCTYTLPWYRDASLNSKIGLLVKGFGTDANCALGCHIHEYDGSSSFSSPCLPRLLLTRGGVLTSFCQCYKWHCSKLVLINDCLRPAAGFFVNSRHSPYSIQSCHNTARNREWPILFMSSYILGRTHYTHFLRKSSKTLWDMAPCWVVISSRCLEEIAASVLNAVKKAYSWE